MNFCNSDPVIPEIRLALFAHFSSPAVRFVTSCPSQSGSLPACLAASGLCCLCPQTLTSHSLPAAACSLWKQVGSWWSWESPVLDMQMPTQPQHMHHLNTGIDWRVRTNQGLNPTQDCTSDVCGIQGDWLGCFWWLLWLFHAIAANLKEHWFPACPMSGPEAS